MRQDRRDVGRHAAAAVLIVGAMMAAPPPARAQNFFDFFFNGGQQPPQQKPQRQQPQPSSFDPFGLFNQPAPAPAPRQASSGGGAAFCVRSCDGRYFPLQTRGVTPAQMCQAFCPAAATKVFFGSNIDYATASGGERYTDSSNAFAFRKALKPDCTCNGRDPLGLAPIDLSLDNSLKAGDVIATSSGLYAFSGVRLGAGQTPEYTPIAAFPGLTADIRAKLGEMKVAPVSADIAGDETAREPETSETHDIAKPAPTLAPKGAKRASIN